jgi:MoaA/NifB/PqqE/SkfB family radical SAM enzyme
MDPIRRSNITAARNSYTSGSEYAGGGPMEAFLEVSARCNLRCQMCAINYDTRYRSSSERPALLTPDLFARLRPVFPTLLRVYLFGLGEPLLNPHLVDYIREASSAGVEVVFTTNATLVDDAKAEEIALGGAERVTVSIDGATAETYEAIRRGARFERVIRGIRALVAAGARHGRPLVDLSFVAMRSNVEEVPLLVDLCADLGCRGVHVEPLFAQVGSPELDEHYARENVGLAVKEHAIAAFSRAATKAAERGVRFGSRFTGETGQFDYAAQPHQAQWACSEPWSSIWVTSAGEVRTCCLNDTSFGNLFEQSFQDIWNGPLYQRFRSEHARLAPAEGCGNCVRNGRVKGSTYFRPTQAVTYRPYFERIPEESDHDPVIVESPSSGAEVTPPIHLAGRTRHGARPDDFDVMIDHTRIITLARDRRFLSRRFEMNLTLDFLTEGAHWVWLREKESGRAFAFREIHYWKV